MTKIHRREILAGAALVAGVAAVTGAIPADATVANVTDVKLPEPAYDDGALTAIYGGRMAATDPWLAKCNALQAEVAARTGSMTLEEALPDVVRVDEGAVYPLFDLLPDEGKGKGVPLLADRVSDWAVDYVLDHGREPAYVNLTRAAFKRGSRLLDIKWADSLDTGVRFTMHGIPVRVPGSKLDAAFVLEASPDTGRAVAPFRVAAAPEGAKVFDVDADGDIDTWLFIDYVNDEVLDGREVTHVYMTRAAYKQTVRDNMIDYVPDEEGHFTVPVFLGRRISVIVGHDRPGLTCLIRQFEDTVSSQ